MDKKATILWVQDYLRDEYMNGLVSYNDESFWFKKEEDGYNLYRLEPELLKIVNENHEKYCEITGHPLKHGDPYTDKSIKLNNKNISPDIVNVDIGFKIQSMNSSISYDHMFLPDKISGEFVIVLQKSDFINFYIPRRLI